MFGRKDSNEAGIVRNSAGFSVRFPPSWSLTPKAYRWNMCPSEAFTISGKAAAPGCPPDNKRKMAIIGLASGKRFLLEDSSPKLIRLICVGDIGFL